jgi:hypothetical protein
VSDPRLRPEELGEIAALPADDPRRRAVEADPIARAQLRAYLDFVAPGRLPEGADVAAAEARLLAALERELGVALEPVVDPGRAPTLAPRRSPGGLFSWITVPAWRPALAVAGALVVIAGGWLWTAPRGGREQPNLRGPAAPITPGPWRAEPSVEAAGAGQVRLKWNAAPGATRYAVVFLAADLHELARVDDRTETEFLLAGDALPAGLVPGQSVLWRADAFQGADEVGRSATVPLTIP